MLYDSTRGGEKKKSFEYVLFTGYAKDGGLFMPQKIPRFTEEDLDCWKRSKSTLKYTSIVFAVVRKYINASEIDDDSLKKCIDLAYESFDTKEILPFRKLRMVEGSEVCTYVAELFHGPTGSFKDYALVLVAQLMNYFLMKRKMHSVVLVGTSGDTGSAAINAVENLPGLDIIVLYPKGRVSKFQEDQITASDAPNVHVYQVDGTSDDLDVPIKQCSAMNGTTSLNSINWARIMVQIAHHMYIWIKCDDGMNPTNIYIPSGAAGNLCGALFAAKMGAEILIYVCTNVNDSLHNFLDRGKLHLGGAVTETPASAMDIQYPYNVERILHMFGCPQPYLIELMEKGDGIIPSKVLTKIKNIVRSIHVISSTRILQTMAYCKKLTGYTVCPHTAIAICSAICNKYADPVVVVATACPSKFMDVWQKLETNLASTFFEHQVVLRKRENNVNVIHKMEKGQDWKMELSNKIKLLLERKVAYVTVT